MAPPTLLRPPIGRIVRKSTNQYLWRAPILVPRAAQCAAFSTTPELQERKPRRDNNRLRGLSSIYRSGTKARMAVDGYELPKPAKYKPEEDVQVDPDHGLWDFFYSKDKSLPTPAEDQEHGRAWTVEELRHKSWEDLHKLWWVCVKERNRIATAATERRRLEFSEGDDASQERDAEVWKTMKAIKFVLTERYYAWEDARKLAETDPEIDLTGKGTPYTPSNYFEEPEAGSSEAEAQALGEAILEEQKNQGAGFLAPEPKGELESPVRKTIDPSTLRPKSQETPNIRP